MRFVLGQPELLMFNGIVNTFELCRLFTLQVISGRLTAQSSCGKEQNFILTKV